MDNTPVPRSVPRQSMVRETVGPTAEVDASRPPEVWVHPPSGNTAILQWDPIMGSAQHNAFERVGFVFDHVAKPEEVKTLETASIDKENQTLRGNASIEDVKNVMARVQAVEAENAKLKEQLGGKPQTATEVSQEHAKDEAVAKTEERGTDNSGSQTDLGGVNAQDSATSAPSAPETTDEPRKALSKQIRQELFQTATAMGLEVDPNATNQQVLDQIRQADEAGNQEGDNE